MDRLREMREKFGLLQQDVASHLNVGKNTISRYENGEREPDIETLKALARLFHTNIGYLAGETDDPAPPGAKKERPTVEDALDGLGITNKEHRKAFAEIAELMRKAENNAEIASELSEEGFNVKYGS